MSAPPVAFAGSMLDRADALRGDAEALAALWRAGARLLRLEGVDPVIAADGRLDWTEAQDQGGDGEHVFLGLDEHGRGCFAPVPATLPLAEPRPAGPLWAAMERLEAHDLAIYGQARSLGIWHARHRFCARCGAATRIAKGGWQRGCTNPACGAEHFPRVDPVVIMLVEHRDAVLLGRQPRFPPHRYSALAGFVEPGETVEEAVAREVYEEAGARARDVRYLASQPWPFPGSLMIGCHAHADDAAIRIDRTELDDARWFTREEVAEALAAAGRDEPGRAFTAPPPVAIARRLLDWWLERG